jgi:hypothetical protein
MANLPLEANIPFARDREAKIFLENRSSLLNTSSRTAGADLGSGHKIEPAQEKVVIASGLLPLLNDEAKALVPDENLTILF